MIPNDALVLLDTNVLVHVIRRNELGQKLIDDFELLVRSSVPLISYVTLAELYALARRWGWGERKLQFIETIRMNLIVVPIERDRILRAYVDVDAWANANGKVLGKNDLWIAATAVASEAYLLTTDGDFAPLQNELLDLVLVDPDAGDILTETN